MADADTRTHSNADAATPSPGRHKAVTARLNRAGVQHPTIAPPVVDER